MLKPYHDLIGGLPQWAQQSITAAIIASIAITIALIIHAVVFRVLRRLAGATASKSDHILVSRIARPTRWALIALALVVAARETPAPLSIACSIVSAPLSLARSALSICSGAASILP